MQRSLQCLFIFSVSLLCSCAGGNGKSEALANYEEIYKNGCGVRIGERHLIAALNDYADSLVASDSAYLNEQKLQQLHDSLNEQNTRLGAAIKTIQALPEFDYPVDLRDKAVDLFEAELNFNRVNVNQALLVFQDGIITDSEKATITNLQAGYAMLQSLYRDWKDMRNTYCNTFGIEYEDVKQLESKYITESEQR